MPCLHCAVHPRVRGEHAANAEGARSVCGSSPRARGTLAAITSPVRGCRFIPACAGNTATAWSPSTTTTVHPRVRGEHDRCAALGVPFFGSSPRARGTRRRRPPRPVGGRFIPACAGNTSRNRRISTCGAVHPRVRGEHSTMCRRAWAIAVHPRVRGEHHRVDALGAADQRFIPACAGNTPSSPSFRRRSPVHPRVRGEHRSSWATGPRPTGSSPRARGTLDAHLARLPRFRFIPACAGNTQAG